MEGEEDDQQSEPPAASASTEAAARATKISRDEELLLKTAIDRSLVDQSQKSVATKVHTAPMPPLHVQSLTSCTAVGAPSQTHPPVGASFGLAAIIQGQRASFDLGIDFGIPARGMCHMPVFLHDIQY